MATKSDIIAKVAKKHPSLKKVYIKAVVDNFFAAFLNALEHRNKTEIRGFGSFSVRTYTPSKENFSASQRLTKNQYFKAYFRTSKVLSSLINE